MTHLRAALRPALLWLIAAAACLGAGSAFAAPEHQGAEPGAGKGKRARAHGVRELPELRTRTSSTYATDRGTKLTRVDTEAVNFRDGKDWKPIDNDLTESGAPGYAFENTANHWSVKLPDALDAKPVEVRDGDAFVRFAPVGAKGTPGKFGTTANYPDAYPGVDVAYDVRAQSVKETLILASPDSRSAFEFDVDTSEGLEAREGAHGSIEFVDSDGEVRFAFAPPTLEDAAGADSTAASMRLERAGSGYRVVLKADRVWLDDSDRRYPVELDPTTTVRYPSPDCSLVGGTGANTTYCGYAWNWVEVGTDGTGDPRRAFLQYDTSAVPSGAEVAEGEFWFNVEAGAAREVHLHRVTRSSTQARTWNKYDGVNNWTTPGGDLSPSPDGKATLGGTTGFQRIQARQMVQDWVDKTNPTHGMILKDGSGTNNILSISASDQGAPNRPQLDIEWTHRIGEQDRWKFADQQLSDRVSLRTNVANGNLILKENDIGISGTAGHDLNFSRSWNSLDVDGGGGDMGHNWNNSQGYDVWLNGEGGDTTQAFQAPGGAWTMFDKNTDGINYTPAKASGINADLKKNGDGTHTLTYRKENRKLAFDTGGQLTSEKDRNDNAITYSYGGPGGKLSAIKDTHEQGTANNTLTLTYTGAGYIDTVTDRSTPTVRTWDYNYTGNKLTSYVNPDGKTTSYGYNASNDLTTITDARGTVTTITYDAQHRVTEIWRDSANAGPKTKYEYPATLSSECQNVGQTDGVAIGETIERDPLYPGSGTTHTTKYCWDKYLRVQKTVDGRGKPRKQDYSGNSDVKTITSAGNQAWKLGYDTDDRAKDAEAPPTSGTTGMKHTFDYGAFTKSDAGGRFWLTNKVTDERGKAVNYTHDTEGNLTDVNLPLPAPQNNIHLTVNGNGTTATIRDANQTGTTTYGYTNGDVTSIDRQNHTAPAGMAQLGTETMTYDAVHRMATHVDGAGQTATFTYDKLDRMTNIAFSGSRGTANVAYGYDNDGNMTSRVDSTGTSTYTYDRLNRLTQEALPNGTTSYTYDAAGNMKTLVDGGGTTTYNYGASNLLDSMQAPGDTAATTFSYTDDGTRDTTTYPNGVVMDAQWEDGSSGNNGPGRLKKLVTKKGATTLASFEYLYTPSAGCSAGSADSTLRHSMITPGGTANYCYDDLGRLTSATGHNAKNYTYTLDGNGNIKQAVRDGTTTSFAYNQADELCWSVNASSTAACGSPPGGATTYSHDADGNLSSSSAAFSASYNVKEQTGTMTSLTGANSTGMTYSGPNQFERVTAGGTTYLNNALGVSAETASSATTRFRRDHEGGLVSERLSSNAIHYYVFDGLGSVAGMSDAAGTTPLPTTYTYDPYGVTTTTGTTPNPWKYASTYQDPTLFYKMGMRYYHPSLMRWTQRDPVEQPTDGAQANRYGYVGGNPVNHVDPQGEYIQRQCILPCGSVNRATRAATGVVRRCLVGASVGQGVSSAAEKLAGVPVRVLTKVNAYAAGISCVLGVARIP